MDPIDRELLAGDDAEPSPRFGARVMFAVRREAQRPPPLRFPWKRCAVGFALLGLWLVLGYPAALHADPAEVRAMARSPLLLAALGFVLGFASLHLTRHRTRA